MKSFAMLAVMLGGFGLLIHQFSFWSVVGVAYMAAMALIVLIAFLSRSPGKGVKTSTLAGSQN